MGRRKEKALTLLELIIVMVALAIVARVLYSKVLRSDVALIKGESVQILRLKKGITQIIETYGVTNFGDTTFQNKVNTFLGGISSKLGGSYSASFDTSRDRITITASYPDSEIAQKVANDLAQTVCGTGVSGCSVVSVTGNNVYYVINFEY